MPLKSARATSAVLAAVGLLTSCAPKGPSVQAAKPGASSLVEVSNAPSPSQPVQTVAARPPPPVITVAMAGEPKSLAEVRLVTTSCEDDKEATDALVAQMKTEIDRNIEDWKQSQPGCWEERRLSAHGSMWGDAIGDSFGAGGLGLTGIGEGGGGRGEGIGLGSIGTIGHGAGMGSGGGVAPKKATSTSKTNNQVEGVDEADLVKTDGTYLYLASNGALQIVEALNPRIVSVTKLGKGVRELFIEGDTAVVYTSTGANRKACTYGYDCTFAGDGSSTTIHTLDISNRAAPKIVRSIELSGSLMSARRIGRTVHTVVADGDPDKPLYETYPDIDTCNTDWHVVYEKFNALKVENERKIRAAASGAYATLTEGSQTTKLCSGYRTKFSDGNASTSVVSFSLDDKETPNVTTLRSRPGAVFASGDALYLSVRHAKSETGGSWYASYDSSVDEVSEIHKFSLGAKPSDTAYVGSGVVPGHVLNQFAMDEWSGYLRVATTSGKVPNPDVSSSVSILREGPDKNLVRVGAVDKIAPGEDIRSVRFDGDRAYVVTFKKTDPLFVIDLYQPDKPEILGELKIPGFSTYMHRLDAGHLLSIGFDADDKGSFAYFNGVILQIFDVTTPTDPKLLFKEKIGSRGSSSEAATNHLAFNWFAEKHLLALPMTICEGGGDGRFGDKLTFSGLLVYDVSLESGFKKLGGVDHGTQGVNCSTWWSNANSAVQRSVFVDDFVYSIAGDRAKVQKMGKLGEDVADLSLLTP